MEPDDVTLAVDRLLEMQLVAFGEITQLYSVGIATGALVQREDIAGHFMDSGP